MSKATENQTNRQLLSIYGSHFCLEAKVLPPLLFPGQFWVLILFLYLSVKYLSIFLSCLLNIIVVLTFVLLLFALLLPPDQVLSLPMSAGGTPTTPQLSLHHYLRHISYISCMVIKENIRRRKLQ